MRKTGRATGVPNRLCRREEIPHPPRDFLSPPPHRRKKGQILEPDRSRANRTGHLDVLTITVRLFRCFDAGSLVILPRRLCKSLSGRAKFLSFLEIARHPLVVSAPHLKDSTIMHYTTNLTRQLSLLSPLCFHGLTNCFSRKLF